jgi:hypothetical protein
MPPCNTETCVKILLWSKIAYKRNSIYRVLVKRGLPVHLIYCNSEYINACMHYDTHYSTDSCDFITDNLFVFAVVYSLLIAITENEEL